MKSYTLEECKRALDAVGVQRGDLVLVHSSLFTLGKLAGCSTAETPEMLARAFLEVLGPGGTLVVPTFNFDFCKGVPFDRQQTPSKGMGNFSEVVRCMDGAQRSSHPMQSVAAIGSHAQDICSPDTPSAFTPDGSFATLLRLDARLVLLGASIQSTSLIHYAEERCAVPYRYWKEFSAEYSDQGEMRVRTYKMFVRDMTINAQLNLRTVERWLRDRHQLQEEALGGGTVKSFLAGDFIQVVSQRLAKDPDVLLRKEEEPTSVHSRDLD